MPVNHVLQMCRRKGLERKFIFVFIFVFDSRMMSDTKIICCKNDRKYTDLIILYTYTKLFKGKHV